MDCTKCNKIQEIDYKNNVKTCCGIYKGPRLKEQDVIAYCIKRNDIEECHLLHPVEALNVAFMLTSTVSEFFDDKDLNKCVNCMVKK